MEIPNIEDSYEDARRKAKLFYADIGRIWCPVLADWIVFNQSGFRHLIWKGDVPRYKSEQKRRFVLLGHVRKILANPNATVTHEYKEKVHFWAFTEKQNNRIVKVIIRQMSMGEKHFLSIFERK